MSEHYAFSPQSHESKELTLDDREVESLKRLEMTPEDLKNLLSEKPSLQGSYAMIFELPGAKNIAKVWKNPTEDSERARTEHVALRFLGKQKYQFSPSISGFIKDRSVLFETKEEGESSPVFDEEVLDQLATALASLHSIELASYGRPLQRRKKGTEFECLSDGMVDLEGRLQNARGSAESISTLKGAIEKLKTEAEKNKQIFSGTTFTLIHFDLNPNNILYSRKDRKLTILDWEQASAGDNAMDIAKLFFKSKFDEQQKTQFLEEYKERLQKQDPDLESRIEIYERFVRINSLLWRLDVLASQSEEPVSQDEQAFYQRVRENFDIEMEEMKHFIKSE